MSEQLIEVLHLRPAPNLVHAPDATKRLVCQAFEGQLEAMLSLFLDHDAYERVASIRVRGYALHEAFCLASLLTRSPVADRTSRWVDVAHDIPSPDVLVYPEATVIDGPCTSSGPGTLFTYQGVYYGQTARTVRPLHGFVPRSVEATGIR